MRTYNDALGREHRLNITLATRSRLMDATGIDLVECAADPDKLQAFLTRISDASELFTVLAAVESCSLDSLLESATLDTQEEAGAALMLAVADFFPQSSPLRVPLINLIEKTRDYQEAAGLDAQQKLNAIVDGLDLSSVPSPSAPPMNGSSDLPPSPDVPTPGTT